MIYLQNFITNYPIKYLSYFSYWTALRNHPLL